MSNLALRIRQLADKHDHLYSQFVATDEIELAIHHRQFSSELFELIINQREAMVVTWITCGNCHRINHYGQVYCRCGHQVEPF